jgi:hypothetical protein
MVLDSSPERAGSLIIYDLSDVDAWEQAAEDREQWGRSRSNVHGLDIDRIVIEFLAETLEAST